MMVSYRLYNLSVKNELMRLKQPNMKDAHRISQKTLSLYKYTLSY